MNLGGSTAETARLRARLATMPASGAEEEARGKPSGVRRKHHRTSTTVEELREEVERALRAKDKEMKRELEQERRRLQKWMEKTMQTRIKELEQKVKMREGGDVYPPETRETERTDSHRHQLSSILPRTPGPQMPSTVTSYVQVFFRLTAHNYRCLRITGVRLGWRIQGQIS